VCGHGTDGAPRPARPASQGARACDFQSDAIADNGTIHSATAGLVSRGEARRDDAVMCADDRAGDFQSDAIAANDGTIHNATTGLVSRGEASIDYTVMCAEDEIGERSERVSMVRRERHDEGRCGRESGMDDDGEAADVVDDTWHRRVAGARPAPTVANPPPPPAPALCGDVTQDGMPTS
jgi:hypothetical protein